MDTIEQVIGQELRRRRDAAGRQQDTVAIAAQRFGLAWGQSTVSAIEAGRRGVSVGELALLPSILKLAGITDTWIRVTDLIPAARDAWALLVPGVELPLATIRSLFGTEAERKAAPRYTPRTGMPTLGIQGSTVLMPPSGALTLTGQHPLTEADRKVARALKVSSEAVSQAALRAWGRPLQIERDARVNDLAASAQKRGRVTRQLIAELKPRLKRKGGR
jgi:hypothetical protein